MFHRAQPGALAKKVAYPVGLNDLSYFTRAFKRQLSVSPSDYQRGEDSKIVLMNGRIVQTLFACTRQDLHEDCVVGLVSETSCCGTLG